MNSFDDTIVAPATPLGEGGIAVIRVSGKSSIEIVDKYFHGNIKIKEAKTHSAHYGKFFSSNFEILDDVVIIIFRTPYSYTGEDVVEINCHGSLFIVEQIVQEITKRGARIANPGEFTKRAFLNGKMDLSQAEAVADLIHSRTEISHRASLNQLQGAIHERINLLREKLLMFCSLLELGLDFSEEGLEFIPHSKLINEIDDIISQVEKLRKTFQISKAVREGIRVAIVGRPNVGKSSIFNYLIADNRAIVTAISGTTRDVIRESITINGLIFHLSDTAGIRNTLDVIEIEGIKKSKEAIKVADIIIFVTDIFQLNEENIHIIENDLKNLIKKESHLIKVVNKVDLRQIRSDIDDETILISALTGEGMDKLKNEILKYGIRDVSGYNEKNLIIINSRHFDSLNKALETLTQVKISIENRMSNEFIVIDIRRTIQSLEEITGNISNEDILDNVFSKFCIGK
jgi:tRNA modification GTPase